MKVTIEKAISFNVALGVQKYHQDFDVELLEFKGLSEDHVWVSVKGTMDNLILLNEKATNYKPSVRHMNDQL